MKRKLSYLSHRMDQTAKLKKILERTRQKLKGTAVELEAHEGLLHLAMEDMKKVYDDLMRSQAQLLQSEKLATVGLLTAGIAHEISSPLMAAQAALHVLEQNMAAFMKGDPKARLNAQDMQSLVDQASACLAHLTRIVRDIRTFSRSDQGVMAEQDLNGIIDSVVNLVWNEIKYKAELKKEYGRLPPVRCNAQQMGQVFINLLMNATQAIPQKGVITIRTAARDRKVFAEVSDTGVGISKENLLKIFHPFFTTKEPDKGTGLGLSICRDIVHRHDGDIAVEGQPGKGAKFTVSLPI